MYFLVDKNFELLSDTERAFLSSYEQGAVYTESEMNRMSVKEGFVKTAFSRILASKNDTYFAEVSHNGKTKTIRFLRGYRYHTLRQEV